MPLLRAARLCAPALALAAALPACGGNVVVDPAGEGGGTTTTPTTPTTPTTTPTPTTTSTVPTTTTTITPTTTSTVTGVCDGTGLCFDGGGASCVDCSIAGPCSDAYNACVANPQCIEVDSCIFSCSDPAGCIEACAAQHPQGFPLYQALVECAICQQCAIDCAGQFPWPCN